MQNLIEKLEKIAGQINPHYDASKEDFDAIYNAAKNDLDLICLGFRFGYMQGTKATRAEIKKYDKQQIIDEIEEWRDIKKFKGLYQVSNHGRVRIADTDVVIKPKTKHGILKVALVKNNRCSILDVHQIVAEAFIPKIEGKNSVIHVDGSYENNHVKNLKWGVFSELLKSC